MKSILIIEGRQTVGGGQVITKKICQALSKHYKVSVFMPGNRDVPLAQYLKGFDQYYYHLKEFNRGKKKLSDYIRFVYNLFFVFIGLFKCLKNNHFDLIYIQHQNILPVVILVNAFFNIPCISHLHIYYTDNITKKLVNQCLSNHNIQQIFGVSNYTLSFLTKKNKEKADILYNGVPLLPVAQQHPWNNRIAIVGDVSPNKGHNILLDALEKQENAQSLFIIGRIVSTKFFNKLTEQAKKTKIISTGMIHNVSEYLIENKIDLVAIPSISGDTFSLAMVEAWSMGIPTIATNDLGMKEVVNTFIPEYSDRLLFEKGNSDDLSQKIFFFSSNEFGKQNICKALRNVVEEKLNENVFENNLVRLVTKKSNPTE